jgi:hypothetical protein
MADTITNIDSIIDQVNISERLSKAGKPYKCLQILLDNGHELVMFTRERAEITMLEQELRIQAMKK